MILCILHPLESEGFIGIEFLPPAPWFDTPVYSSAHLIATSDHNTCEQTYLGGLSLFIGQSTGISRPKGLVYHLPSHQPSLGQFNSQRPNFSQLQDSVVGQTTSGLLKTTCQRYSNTRPLTAEIRSVVHNHWRILSYVCTGLKSTCSLDTANCAQHGAPR